MSESTKDGPADDHEGRGGTRPAPRWRLRAIMGFPAVDTRPSR